MHGTKNPTYDSVIQRYIPEPENKDNGALVSQIYTFMSKNHRNEYVYQNTLFNTLLLEKHNLATTAALAQLPIGKSKADFITISSQATVYEIKTELDSFDRLKTQLTDYYKAFDRVCLVTSKSNYKRANTLLEGTPVGIYTLNHQNTISSKLKKEPISF